MSAHRSGRPKSHKRSTNRESYRGVQMVQGGPLSVVPRLPISHFYHSSLFPLNLPGPLSVTSHKYEIRDAIGGPLSGWLTADTSRRGHRHLRNSVRWFVLDMSLLSYFSSGDVWSNAYEPLFGTKLLWRIFSERDGIVRVLFFARFDSN